jgi:hypothetical protein
MGLSATKLEIFKAKPATPKFAFFGLRQVWALFDTLTP